MNDYLVPGSHYGDHCQHVYDYKNQLPKRAYKAVPFTNPKPIPQPCGEDYKPWLD